ncbi:HAD family hydrolase [Neobacillus niacini]|uniref:HAD family hydrolase n=1 Tax=Neobacillus niacini TaxID=86668 RepID=UPI0005F08200|nr:HAD family hydrolase [Neobacillus niacini]
MILASDLDRTIMYSNRAIEEFGFPENKVLKPVERNKGNWTGYMTEAAFSMLKEVSKHSLFIPVTTRTTEQFKRFVIFEEEIPLSYAITSNGAHILYNGEPLKEWAEHLELQLNNGCAPEEELDFALKSAGITLDGERKQAENLFFYYILNCLPTPSELAEIRELTVKYGWKMSLQGRKLYFIPSAISKGKALEFICNREGMEAMAGAGDSVLDWDFLKNCRYRFVPSHGELLKVKGPADITLTNQLGVAAGEEILQHFLKALSLKI